MIAEYSAIYITSTYGLAKCEYNISSSRMCVTKLFHQKTLIYLLLTVI